MNIKDRLAQALMASQAVVPPTDPNAAAMAAAPQASPLLLNQPLEAAAQAQGQAAPLHPLVAAIMQHMGLLNMVRNRNNSMTVDPETQAQSSPIQ